MMSLFLETSAEGIFLIFYCLIHSFIHCRSKENMVIQKIKCAFELLLIGGLAVILNTAMAREEVCATGLVMDWFCIEQGTLLDPANTPTLVKPVIHTVHCLVEVPQCVNSGFAILRDPSAVGENYTIGYNVTAAGNEMLLALMKAEGQCVACNGTGTIVNGFRVGVRGLILDSNAEPPLVEITDMVAVSASSEYCEKTPPATTPAASPTTGGSAANSARSFSSLFLLFIGMVLV